MRHNKNTKKISPKKLFALLTFWKKTALLVISLLIVVSILSLQTSYAVQRASKQVFFSTKHFFSELGKTNATVKLKVPVHKQEHALSCEIATLKMAIDFYGDEVDEQELLDKLPFATKNARDEKNNIWADPNKGFVGDIDGQMPNSGYGVYEKPIASVALDYRNAESLDGATLERVIQEISSGHPVIIWGTTGKVRDISWNDSDGNEIKAVNGEHTKVVVGYSGTAEDPKTLYLIDPVYGEVTMSKEKFLEDWAHLGNRAVVVY